MCSSPRCNAVANHDAVQNHSSTVSANQHIRSRPRLTYSTPTYEV